MRRLAVDTPPHPVDNAFTSEPVGQHGARLYLIAGWRRQSSHCVLLTHARRPSREARPRDSGPRPSLWPDDFPHPPRLGAEVVVPQPARHRHRVNDVVKLPLSLRSTEGFVVGLGVLVHPEVRQLPARHLSQRQEGVELQPVALVLLGETLSVADQVALGYVEEVHARGVGLVVLPTMDKDGRVGVDAVLGEGLDGSCANAGAVRRYPHHGSLVPEGRLLEQLGHLPDDARVAYVPAPADLPNCQGGPALEPPTVVLDHELGYGRRRDLQRRAPSALLVGVAQLVYDLLGERPRRPVVERLLED